MNHSLNSSLFPHSLSQSIHHSLITILPSLSPPGHSHIRYSRLLRHPSLRILHPATGQRRAHVHQRYCRDRALQRALLARGLQQEPGQRICAALAYRRRRRAASNVRRWGSAHGEARLSVAVHGANERGGAEQQQQQRHVQQKLQPLQVSESVSQLVSQLVS